MKKHPWFKVRGYRHFDDKVHAKDLISIEKLVNSPKSIESWAFHPLIQYDITKHKIVEDSLTGKRYLDDTKKRSITYAGHRDSQVFSYYASLLVQSYDKFAHDNQLADVVTAFRRVVDPVTKKGKCNIHFAREAFNAIKSFDSCSVIALDVKSFFDSLNKEILLDRLRALTRAPLLADDLFKVVRACTNRSFVKLEFLKSRFAFDPENLNGKRICSPSEFRTIVRPSLSKIDGGIAQGLPISGVLANIYMIEFDLAVSRLVSSIGGMYYRYCDDILIVVPGRENYQIVDDVKKQLAYHDLKLSDGKTQMSDVWRSSGRHECSRAIQYLGFNYDGASVSLRPGSISNFLREAKSAARGVRINYANESLRRRKAGLAPTKPYLKRFRERFTPTGKRNFISYGNSAARILESSAIKRQIKSINRQVEFLISEVKSRD